MKSEDELAAEVARILAPLSAEQHPMSVDRERDLWLKISAKVEAPQAYRGWLWLGAAAVVAAALMLFVGQQPEASTPTEAAGRVASVSPGPSTPGLTPGAPATPIEPQPRWLEGRRALPSGSTAIALSGRVEVLESTHEKTRLKLAAGAAVESIVAPIPAGGYYVVQTPTATVSVRGTRFVTRTEAGATEVIVTEGKVHVAPTDGRRARLVVAGERLRLEPLSEAGAQAAMDAGDALGAAEILVHLSRRSTGLGARNLHLRAGRSIQTSHPREAAAIWAEAVRVYPTGMHAEEFAFRLGEAWHLSGEPARARTAGAQFRQRFPAASRAQLTTAW